MPANQRLVIEQVSGSCTSGVTYLDMSAYQPGVTFARQYLPASFAKGTALLASQPVRFYVNPGADFNFGIVTDATPGCR
jgi:hypothetical protein